MEALTWSPHPLLHSRDLQHVRGPIIGSKDCDLGDFQFRPSQTELFFSFLFFFLLSLFIFPPSFLSILNLLEAGIPKAKGSAPEALRFV